MNSLIVRVETWNTRLPGHTLLALFPMWREGSWGWGGLNPSWTLQAACWCHSLRLSCSAHWVWCHLPFRLFSPFSQCCKLLHRIIKIGPNRPDEVMKQRKWKQYDSNKILNIYHKKCLDRDKTSRRDSKQAVDLLCLNCYWYEINN